MIRQEVKSPKPDTGTPLPRPYDEDSKQEDLDA